MDYKLVAVDLDRTLLHTDGTISPYTKEMVKKCRDAGVGFTLATGRMYCSAQPFAESLHLDLPLITYQGALVKDLNGKVISSLHLDADLALQVEEYLRQTGAHYTIYSDEDMYFSTFGQLFLDYAHHIGVKPKMVPQRMGQLEVTQFGVFAEPETIRIIKRQIDHVFQGKVKTVVSGGHFLEICHPMAKKSHGLQQLAEQMGIRQEEIVAVGDNNNDLDMIEYAGLGVAVDNALPAVKHIANHITTSNDDDGVARLLREVLQKQTR